MNNFFNKVYAYIKENFNLKEFIINFVILGVIIFLAFYRFPYVIYKAGGIINIADRITIDGQKNDIGNYNMAYVAVSHANLPSIIASFFIKNWDVKKESEMVVGNTDFNTTLKIEHIEMTNAMNIAKYVALTSSGYDATIDIQKSVIYLVLEDANTDIKELDEIISYDGIDFTDLKAFKEYINSLKAGDKITLKVLNDGKEYERYAYIFEKENNKMIGIYMYNLYDLKSDINIDITSKSSEAGSSGGLMLTLAIYDALNDEDISKGRTIVGTGTIELDGTVGEIGGVKYKMLAAEKDKADIFFVPEKNYKEAKKVYDDNKLSFKLVKVKTFNDAIEYLKK